MFYIKLVVVKIFNSVGKNKPVQIQIPLIRKYIRI